MYLFSRLDSVQDSVANHDALGSDLEQRLVETFFSLREHPTEGLVHKLLVACSAHARGVQQVHKLPVVGHRAVTIQYEFTPSVKIRALC